MQTCARYRIKRRALISKSTLIPSIYSSFYLSSYVVFRPLLFLGLLGYLSLTAFVCGVSKNRSGLESASGFEKKSYHRGLFLFIPNHCLISLVPWVKCHGEILELTFMRLDQVTH